MDKLCMCHFVKNLSPFSFLYFLKSMVPVPGSPVPSVSPVAPVYTLDGVVDTHHNLKDVVWTFQPSPNYK